MKRSTTATVAIHALALAVLVVTLAPFVWLVIVSISRPVDLVQKPLQWLPSALDLSRFGKLMSAQANSAGALFLAALRNSLVVALGATTISVLVGIPAAYAFSRMRGSHSGVLYAVLGLYMMPVVALVLPLYAALSYLGLLNSVTGLIIVNCAILTPFTTWLLKSNFDSIPVEIEAAAIIDGATFLQTLRHITLPLARSGTRTAILFAILLAWDEFFFALLFTSNTQSKTLPVAIADFAAGRATDFGLVATAGLLAALPPVLIALFLQRSLVAGLTAGGVKG